METQAKLQTLADIHSGYLFRGAVEHTSSGEWGVIQIKDLVEHGHLSKSALTSAHLDTDPSDKYLLHEGDILLRTRSNQSFPAVLIKESFPKKTVAAAQFFYVRVSDKRLLPAYLSWHLNQPVSQQYLLSKAKGTALKAIGIQAVKDLPIPVPSIETQKRIIQLNELLKNHEAYTSALHMRLGEMVSYACAKVVASH